MSLDAVHEQVTGNGEEKAEDDAKETKNEEAKPKPDVDLSEKRDVKVETGNKEPTAVKEGVIDKELLQVFLLNIIPLSFSIFIRVVIIFFYTLSNNAIFLRLSGFLIVIELAILG